jgi:hypothetical protein
MLGLAYTSGDYRKLLDQIKSNSTVGIVFDMREASTDPSTMHMAYSSGKPIGGSMHFILDEKYKGVIGHNLTLPCVPAVSMNNTNDRVTLIPLAKMPNISALNAILNL